MDGGDGTRDQTGVQKEEFSSRWGSQRTDCERVSGI